MHADQLPVVPERIEQSGVAICVEDSREGWADALRLLLAGLYSGVLRPLDTSAVRPEGSILKTFGGLASGPRPLHELHEFAAATFRGAAGRRLTPLECHDLVCKIGESVVVGGVRRCACADEPVQLMRLCNSPAVSGTLPRHDARAGRRRCSRAARQDPHSHSRRLSAGPR
jgi:hypothetical protein